MSLNCCAMTGVKSQGNVEESFKRDKSRRKTKKSGNFAWGQSQWKLPTELWKKGRDLLRIFQRQKKINGEWNLINIMTKFTSSSHSVQKGYSHAPSERDERGGQTRKERSEIENYYKIFKPTDDGHARLLCTLLQNQNSSPLIILSLFSVKITSKLRGKKENNFEIEIFELNK